MQLEIHTVYHPRYLQRYIRKDHVTKWFYGEGDLLSNRMLLSSKFNSSLNDKISDWSKLRAFADDKINVIEKLKFLLGRVENIAGKGENAGYQHFRLFPQCFQRVSFSRLLKVGIVW